MKTKKEDFEVLVFLCYFIIFYLLLTEDTSMSNEKIIFISVVFSFIMTPITVFARKKYELANTPKEEPKQLITEDKLDTICKELAEMSDEEFEKNVQELLKFIRRNK